LTKPGKIAKIRGLSVVWPCSETEIKALEDREFNDNR